MLNYDSWEEKFFKKSNTRRSIKKLFIDDSPSSQFPAGVSSKSSKNILLKSNSSTSSIANEFKSSFDYFAKDVGSSLSDWKSKMNTVKSWTTGASGSLVGTPNGDVKVLCANELSFCIERLQKIIYEETDEGEEDKGEKESGSREESTSRDSSKDNKNLAEMCLILANLKHTRDVLKGVLPVSSLGQLNG